MSCPMMWQSVSQCSPWTRAAHCSFPTSSEFQSSTLATHCSNNRLRNISPKDIPDQLKFAATANCHETGMLAKGISARSLRPGSDVALLCGNVDFDFLKLLGHWHSDAMIRCLHAQDQPIMCRFAKQMFNNGTHNFLPSETVPLAQ